MSDSKELTRRQRLTFRFLGSLATGGFLYLALWWIMEVSHQYSLIVAGGSLLLGMLFGEKFLNVIWKIIEHAE